MKATIGVLSFAWEENTQNLAYPSLTFRYWTFHNLQTDQAFKGLSSLAGGLPGILG